MLEHYNVSIGKDKTFLDKAGILMEEEELDLVQPNNTEKGDKYNVNKAVVARNHSIAVLFLKKAGKSRYRGLWKIWRICTQEDTIIILRSNHIVQCTVEQ